MQQYLLAHIDAVITTVFGAFFSFISIRNRSELNQSTNKLRRALPILAPLVLIWGLMQFAIPSKRSEPHPTPKLQVVTTEDGVSSVAFPISPTKRESTDRAQGIEVHRITYEAETEGGKLNFRLSYSDFPPGSPPLSAKERCDALRDFLAQGGTEILEDSTDQYGIRKLVASQSKDGTRMAMRIGVMPNGVYRAFVTTMDGCHEDSRIAPFLESFTMNTKSTEIASPNGP